VYFKVLLPSPKRDYSARATERPNHHRGGMRIEADILRIFVGNFGIAEYFRPYDVELEPVQAQFYMLIHDSMGDSNMRIK
ncbi:2188_t:CDS:2, partial [Acaulospora colombiana]